MKGRYFSISIFQGRIAENYLQVILEFFVWNTKNEDIVIHKSIINNLHWTWRKSFTREENNLSNCKIKRRYATTIIYIYDWRNI